MSGQEQQPAERGGMLIADSLQRRPIPASWRQVLQRAFHRGGGTIRPVRKAMPRSIMTANPMTDVRNQQAVNDIFHVQSGGSLSG